MEGDTVHMLYRQGGATAKIYYLILDFNQSTAQATLLYTDIYGTTEAFFVGSKSESVDGLQVH